MSEALMEKGFQSRNEVAVSSGQNKGFANAKRKLSFNKPESN